MNIERFLETLPVLLTGMAGIFLVTGILIVSIVILNHTQKTKDQE